MFSSLCRAPVLMIDIDMANKMGICCVNALTGGDAFVGLAEG